MAYNFSPGPAVLPSSVREEIVAEIAGSLVGVSIIESSHRGKAYDAVHWEAMDLCRRLYAVPDEIAIIFLQGGATLQFAMVPQNLIRPGRSADFVLSGSWAKKALAEAKILGAGHRVAGSSEDRGFTCVPHQRELDFDSAAEYAHITTNNTIYGTQAHVFPDTGAVPIAADMSSDLLSRPVPWDRVGIAYGGVQKNAGVAGLTTVFIKRELLDRESSSTPTPLRYSTYAESDSLYNTPPVFAVFCFLLVLRWIDRQGGLKALARENGAKAARVYEAVDQSGGFYRGYAEVPSRSIMNVTYNLQNGDLEPRFVREAETAGLLNLAGHRSVGGVRASLYNAMSLEGCEALADFMADFARRNG